MSLRPYLSLFLSIAIAALAVPLLAKAAQQWLDRPGPQVQSVAEPPSAPMPAPLPVAPPPPGIAVTIARSGDSHFRADASINGFPVAMLVDSGASLVVLTPADARAAGIMLSPADFTGSARTASGDAPTANVVIDRLSVGGIERRQVRAAVMQGDVLPQSLLGQSFLATLAEMRVEGDAMTLR